MATIMFTNRRQPAVKSYPSAPNIETWSPSTQYGLVAGSMYQQVHAS